MGTRGTPPPMPQEVKLGVERKLGFVVPGDGRTRTVTFFLPPAKSSAREKTKKSLIIAFHGSQENGDQFRLFSSDYAYDVEAARREDYVVAYPDGFQVRSSF